MIDVRTNLESILQDEAAYLLDHRCETIPRELVHAPGPDFVERVWVASDRSPRVLRSMQALFDHGRLGGTGYLSILPMDHAISYGAGSAFAPSPRYFDPEAIVTLALEGGCSAVLAPFGVLGAVARRYAHRIPFILKANHHETLSYPNRPDQVFYARVEDAFAMGCLGVAATVYFGSPESRRQLQEVSEAFARAHELGMFTILFCYLFESAFRKDDANYECAADLTGQANHLGVTVEADFIKQKQPTLNGGFRALNVGNGVYGKLDERIYTELCSEHPIDLTRYQVANCYMGRCGLINSGGASTGDDLQQAVRTAVINKRAGGMGLLSGRKVFQRPVHDGVELLHAIHAVYKDSNVTLA